MSEKLLCNIRNVKRPIVGLIPGKRIVRDELGIELACRQYMRIKRDCNVFAVINGDEFIIPTGEEFNTYLSMQETVNSEKVKDVKPPLTNAVDATTSDSITTTNTYNYSDFVKPVDNVTITQEANNNITYTGDVHPVDESVEDDVNNSSENDKEENTDTVKDEGIDYTEEELEAISEVTNKDFTKNNNSNSNRRNNKKRNR